MNILNIYKTNRLKILAKFPTMYASCIKIERKI